MRTLITTTKFLTLAALLLAPLGVMAAGLGKLNVLSGLGQPLRAEIEIVSLQRGEAESLAAKIGSPDAFREAGVEYGAVVPRVRAVLERRADRYVIVLTTPQPVEEPFLDLLVELNWAAGRLVRQYTFLLDPAEYKGPQPIAAAPPKPVVPEVRPVEAPTQPALTATTPAAPIAQPPAPAVEQAQAPAAPIVQAPLSAAPTTTALVEVPPGSETKYEVKPGDTLGKIAQQYKADGVTVQQMLVALYRANEDAFINRNMNLLRSGRVLNVPEQSAAEAVAPAEANRIVLAQAQDFNEYRNKLAATVAAAPAPATAAQQRAAGRITDKPEETAAAKSAPSDQLRVSKAEEAAKGGKAAATARADDLAARERALRDASERVAELEKNVGDLQKLLELKNQQLSDLQKQAQAAAKAPAAPAAKAPESAKAAEAPKPKPAEIAAAPAAKPAEPAPKPEAPPAKAGEAPKAEAPKPEAPPAVAAAPADKPAAPVAAPPAAKKAAPPPPPAEPNLLEAFLDDPLYPAGVGGGLLAVLVAGYLWRRKKSARLENSLLGSTTDSSSVFGTTGGRSIDTGGSSIQTDFSQGGIGTIDTDEVDPVAEADVYMAYGRDAQAEEILKEALQKDPNRQAVRVKLLEIYAARKDLKAFETTAGEIYAATGGHGPEWQKAVELGLQTDPTNPMYGGKSAAAAPPADTFALAGATATAVAGTDIAFDLSEKMPASIDFDLGAATKTAEEAPDITLDVVSQAPADLGFDLNLGEEKAAEEASDFSPSGTFIMDAATKKAVSEMVEAQSKSGALAIDFELPGASPGGGAGFDQTAKMRASQPAAAFDFKLDEVPTKQPAGPVDLSGISFDLGTSGVQTAAPVDAHWQEVATKLDLAKAYEEMGDRDGARELLNEVVKEGDTAQQQQAKQMLETLR